MADMKWIPVTERLPKGTDGRSICEVVIVQTNRDFVRSQVCVGWLNGAWWHLILDEDDFYTTWEFEAVTHWMPLPEPPKGGRVMELKPCPFCGGKAEVWVEFVPYETKYERDEQNMYHCGCKECRIYSSYLWWKEGAIEAWNRRAEDGKV